MNRCLEFTFSDLVVSGLESAQFLLMNNVVLVSQMDGHRYMNVTTTTTMQSRALIVSEIIYEIFIYLVAPHSCTVISHIYQNRALNRITEIITVTCIIVQQLFSSISNGLCHTSLTQIEIEAWRTWDHLDGTLDIVTLRLSLLFSKKRVGLKETQNFLSSPAFLRRISDVLAYSDMLNQAGFGLIYG
ncbi:hypothetical protein BJ138DRAFT_838594 [Hygrophoropsis aurantiaca]|uniref:Uncharacterized protein n=1 Tax=Hygrophoropsis aurantiaca TaxID=72124 RepID=A0ACB7ZXB5_9AGAM|nr:hypothetical protein BJ138DRAFT_838594 [Hygrophoropsis aurantiaca]